MTQQEIDDNCAFIIDNRSKAWLAEKLGKTMPTLNKRLVKKDWRFAEIAVIEEAAAVISKTIEMEASINN